MIRGFLYGLLAGAVTAAATIVVLGEVNFVAVTLAAFVTALVMARVVK